MCYNPTIPRENCTDDDTQHSAFFIFSFYPSACRLACVLAPFNLSGPLGCQQLLRLRMKLDIGTVNFLGLSVFQCQASKRDDLLGLAKLTASISAVFSNDFVCVCSHVTVKSSSYDECLSYSSIYVTKHHDQGNI